VGEYFGEDGDICAGAGGGRKVWWENILVRMGTFAQVLE
jgi:hypothetical protein